MSEAVVLRDLLRDKHWQTYSTFCKRYDKVAREIDSSYVGTWPSRAQLHRWQAGDLKGLPHSQHCEVLEGMFPGVRVAEMFAPSPRLGGPGGAVDLARVVEEGLDGAAPTPDAWAAPRVGPAEVPTPRLPLRVRDDEAADQAQELARSLQVLGKRMRIPDDEVAQLAQLAGQLINLELE